MKSNHPVVVMKKIGFCVFATIRRVYVSLSTYNHPSNWELWDKQINRRYAPRGRPTLM
jgi:hypothetical protein